MSETAEYPTGRTRAAQAPLASADPSTVIPIAPTTGEPGSPASADAPPGDAHPASAIKFADPSTVVTPRPAVHPGGAASSVEEQALLAVLRLIDRNIVAGSLTPVERAFVEGARVMFDHLAKACKDLLDRELPSPATKKGASPESPTSSRPGKGSRAAATA